MDFSFGKRAAVGGIPSAGGWIYGLVMNPVHGPGSAFCGVDLRSGRGWRDVGRPGKRGSGGNDRESIRS